LLHGFVENLQHLHDDLLFRLIASETVLLTYKIKMEEQK